jgi:hypothetical protein
MKNTMKNMMAKIEILSITLFVVVMGIFVFSGLPYGFITKPLLYTGIGIGAGYMIGSKKG